MEVISGTASGGGHPRGWNWGPNSEPVAVEPGGDYQVVITTTAGGALEWRDLDSTGNPTTGWTQLPPGSSITRTKGQRVQLRPVAAGGAGALFAWSGPGLEELAKYTGAKGSKVTWG